MKGIKKYTKSYDVTKQLAKEKLGKASNSADSEEIKYIKEKLHLIKWILKHSKISGADYIHYNETLTDKITVFANVLSAMGDGGTIDAPIGSASTIVGNVMKENAQQDRSLSSTTREHLIEPLARIYESDAKLVLECKERQEVSRLQYESAQVKVKDNQKKGGKKLQEAEQELQTTKSNYESLTAELASQCSNLIKKINDQLFPHIQAFVAAQTERYCKLAEQWRATQETVNHLAATPFTPHTLSLSSFSLPLESNHAYTQVYHQQKASNNNNNNNNNINVNNNVSAPIQEEIPQNNVNNFNNNNNYNTNNYNNNINPNNNFDNNGNNGAINNNNNNDGNPFEAPPMPALPSQMNFAQTTTYRQSTNYGQPTNQTQTTNYYPSENDPFQQNVGSQPDPFSQPNNNNNGNNNNIYSR